MANYYTSSKGITFDMDQAAQRRRTNVDSRTGKNTYKDRSTGNKNTGNSVDTGSTGGGDSALLAYFKALEARQQQAANDAYNRNVAAMNNAFTERGKLMENNLNTTLQNLQTDYDASKAALISLTHNMAIEFSPYINVNAITPGFIGTESELEGMDEEFIKNEEEKILVKRMGTPSDVAKLVKFLVSDDASFINNSVIRVDGGQYGSN